MAKRAKAPNQSEMQRRDAIVAQRAVDEAGSASRQATRKFYDTLDAHMRGRADPTVVMAAARNMWTVNQALRRLETKHDMKPRKRAPSATSSAGASARRASKTNLFGVRTIL